MELFQGVDCPFCGGRTEVGVDTSVDDQTFTIDCEVCCRPFQIRVECEPGEIVRLEVLAD